MVQSNLVEMFLIHMQVHARRHIVEIRQVDLKLIVFIYWIDVCACYLLTFVVSFLNGFD